MNEEVKEKKWTEWSVVSTGDGGGEYRCKRTNVEDANDAQYREVPRPVFNKRELTALVNFGQTGLLPSADLVGSVYDVRYRALAFRLCSELNAEAKK